MNLIILMYPHGMNSSTCGLGNLKGILMGWTRPLVDLIMNLSICGLNNFNVSPWDEFVYLWT